MEVSMMKYILSTCLLSVSVFTLFFSSLTNAQIAPSWPPELCGSNVKGDSFMVARYLRFYPTADTARRNVLLPEDDLSNLGPDNDFHDLLTGLSPENDQYNFDVVVYTNEDLSQSHTPVSIIVPLWFPTLKVDFDDFKLRDVSTVVPRLLNLSNPDIPGPSAGGGMHKGAINHSCIVEIGPSENNFTLVYVQGWVWRNTPLTSYFSPFTFP